MSKTNSSDPTQAFGDLARMLEQFKVPGVDMSAIVESRRKDVEALIAANQSTFEAMQLIAKKQTEILTQAMQTAQEGVQAQLKGGISAAPDPAKQAEIARKAYEKAMADMKELAEIARKAQTEAAAGITARAQQSVQEIKNFMQPK